MAEQRRFSIGDFFLLVLVIALAGGARAAYLIECCDSGRSPGPLLVQDPRMAWQTAGAARLVAEPGQRGARSAPAQTKNDEANKDQDPAPLAGYGPVTELDELVDSVKDRFSFTSRTPYSPRKEEVTAHASPGYPWVVGLVARYVKQDALPQTIRWGQCVLGTLTAALYFLFARRAFGSSLVAALAGIFCALHPFWVIDTATIDDGVLATFALAAALFFGVRGVQASGAFSSLLHGLMLAAVSMVRATMLPFAFVTFLWFLLRCRTVPRGWLCALLAFLGFVNGMAPWMVRNWQRFHDVIPIVNSGWTHMWMGNYPDATGGPIPNADWGKFATANYGENYPRERREAFIAQAVEDEVRRDQVETVNRRLNAGLYFFFGKLWFDRHALAQEIATSEEMPHWLERAYPGALAGSLLAMLLLGVLGWRWTYGWRFTSMPASLAVMWIPLPYILSHAENLSGPRLPIDGVLLCYAAFAIGCFIPRLSGSLLAGYRTPVVREPVRR